MTKEEQSVIDAARKVLAYLLPDSKKSNDDVDGARSVILLRNALKQLDALPAQPVHVCIKCLPSWSGSMPSPLLQPQECYVCSMPCGVGHWLLLPNDKYLVALCEPAKPAKK
jgi:hypothetical protein